MNRDILLIDNYDSFTFNLVHLIEAIYGIRPRVLRVDDVKEEDILNSIAVVISPGPGLPNEMGPLMKWVKLSVENKAVLGVCLGHQAIAQFYGASLKQLNEVFHGISRSGYVVQKFPMYQSISETFEAGSYHSWTVNPIDFPDCLQITAIDQANEILSYIHLSKPIWGVQYHPESILTPCGKQLMENWISSWNS